MNTLAISFIGAICLLVISFSVRLRRHYLISHANGCQLPKKYPHKDPFLGLDLFFKTKRLFEENKYLTDSFERYTTLGRTFETNLLGSRSISSIEPLNLQTVYSKNFRDWGVQPIRLPAQDEFCGAGFITTDGAHWEHSLALLKPSLTKANIEFSGLERGLQLMLQRVPRDGSTVDLQPLLLQLYLDTSTAFLFGESFDSLSEDGISEEAQDFMKAVDLAMFASALRIAFGKFKFLLPKAKFLEGCRETHRFVERYVDKALEYRESFLAHEKAGFGEEEGNLRSGRNLLCTMAEQTGDRVRLRSEAIQAMMAAQETTAVLLSNTFMNLARYPEVWNRLGNEVRSLGHQDLDVDTLLSMKYLRNIFNETLRLYPNFPQNNRIALNDTTLPVGGGPDGNSPVFVPAGTMFDTSFYALHRLPSIWGSDADEFKPDRWDTFKPGNWEYKPFGGGPRSCHGRQKALAEGAYIIVRMLQEFKGIESRDEREWVGQVQLTAKNLNGCKVAMIPA